MRTARLQQDCLREESLKRSNTGPEKHEMPVLWEYVHVQYNIQHTVRINDARIGG